MIRTDAAQSGIQDPMQFANAVAYAKYRSHSRSHRAIIRMFDESGAAIETHEFAADFRQWQAHPKKITNARPRPDQIVQREISKVVASIRRRN